ncbi:MAG: 50S ribosomal protein L29 [Candidatus Kapaibacteriales bacterium]
MKPRKAKYLRELTYEELERMLQDSIETLSRLRFQHSLSQLHDTASIKILRKDIARLKLIIAEKHKESASTNS